MTITELIRSIGEKVFLPFVALCLMGVFSSVSFAEEATTNKPAPELPSIHSSSIPGLFRCKYAPAIHLRRVRGCMILPDYQKVPGINERSRRAVREKGSGGNSRKRKPQSTPGAKRKVTALKRPKWCMGVPEDWRKNRQRKRPRDHLESMLYQRGSRRSYGISAICASGAFELIMKSGSIRRN